MKRVRHEHDPLYDPALLIFVYTGWAVTSWFVGALIGLAILVVGTTVLLAVGLRHATTRDPAVPFIADLGLITLFCSAALGAGILVVKLV